MTEAKPKTAGEDTKLLTPDSKNFLTNILIKLKGPLEFECEYRNWRGEVATRRLRAVEFWHGSTEWHPTPGLMLKAIDLDKDVERDFSVSDFNSTTLRLIE
jgi:hypothetical protein